MLEVACREQEVAIGEIVKFNRPLGIIFPLSSFHKSSKAMIFCFIPGSGSGWQMSDLEPLDSYEAHGFFVKRAIRVINAG